MILKRKQCRFCGEYYEGNLSSCPNCKSDICTNCGSTNIEYISKGSCLMEFVLFLLFIAPWIIYAIWRSTNKTLRCRDCKSYNIIPINSPKGKILAKELSSITKENQQNDENIYTEFSMENEILNKNIGVLPASVPTILEPLKKKLLNENIGVPLLGVLFLILMVSSLLNTDTAVKHEKTKAIDSRFNNIPILETATSENLTKADIAWHALNTYGFNCEEVITKGNLSGGYYMVTCSSGLQLRVYPRKKFHPKMSEQKS